MSFYRWVKNVSSYCCCSANQDELSELPDRICSRHVCCYPRNSRTDTQPMTPAKGCIRPCNTYGRIHSSSQMNPGLRVYENEAT